ncbi:hypothetical protein EDB84DRAFT_1680112 [Lactarius hengduanensis]|nr:hypothetical protein EDB84DRAFT_1680112 [Lactarius hengduanensis]
MCEVVFLMVYAGGAPGVEKPNHGGGCGSTPPLGDNIWSQPCIWLTGPGSSREEMGLEVATKALLDAGNVLPSVRHNLICVHSHVPGRRRRSTGRHSVEAAFIGYVYGASTTSQAVLYQFGLTGVPITNVNNNSLTGSTALVRAGGAPGTLALGFERMGRSRPTLRSLPPQPHVLAFRSRGARLARFKAWAADAAHLRSRSRSVFQAVWQWGGTSGEDSTRGSGRGKNEVAVPASPQISNELTECMCSPTFIAYKLALRSTPRPENQAVELAETGIGTDFADAIAGHSAMDAGGYGMTRRLADTIFAQTGGSRDDVGVIELCDCFALTRYAQSSHWFEPHTEWSRLCFFAQLITYPAIGLCAIDDAHRLVGRGNNMGFNSSCIVVLKCSRGQATGYAGLMGIRPSLRGLMHNIMTLGSVAQSLSASSVAQNFITPTARTDATDWDNHAHDSELRAITRADVIKRWDPRADQMVIR